MASLDFPTIAANMLESARQRGLARQVTLRRLNTAPADPQKAWRGPADPRAGAATLTITAVFVEPSSFQQLGLNADLVDWVKKAQQVGIVASTTDLSEYSELLDGADVWRVIGVSTLRPGADRILHFLGVAR